VTVSFVMSVSVSVLPSHEITHYEWPDFNETGYWWIFRNSVEKIQVLLKSDKNNGTLHGELSTFVIII
jgi:hypothetical protein